MKIVVPLLLGSSAAFLAPPRPARAAWPLSFSDEDADWPSDSSDAYEDGPLSTAAATIMAPEALAVKKDQLLVKMIAAVRGEAPGPINGAVARLAAELEATAQTADFSLELLEGRWALAYSSTQLFRASPFWMAGRATCADGAQARQYDWFCDQHRAATRVGTIGAVRQLIDASKRTVVSEFETTVAALPMRVGGSLPLAVEGAIVTTADIVDFDRGTMALLVDDVQVKGSNVPGLRGLLDAGLRLDSRALATALESIPGLNFEAPRPPRFRTTFLDDDLRIARDVDENLFVYVRESRDPAPTDYDAIPADLGIPKTLKNLADALSGGSSS